MRRISSVLSARCLVAVLPCVAACSAPADPPVQGGTDPAPVDRAAASVHDVQIGVLSPVSFDAQPYAECNVHSNTGDAASGLHVQADDLGHAVLQVQTEDSATLVVDCDGEAAPRTIALRPVVSLPAATSTPHAGPSNGRAHARRVQEPLAGDPMALTPAELLARGYPPRPDPIAAPAQFARWLDVVSRPMEAVAPNPNMTKPCVGPVTMNNISNLYPSPNWSGFVSNQPGTVYGNVIAEWYAPGMAGSESGADKASVWIGLGGTNGNSPLVQAGTTLAVSSFPFCFRGSCFPLTLQSTTPWIEVVPSPLGQGQVNPSITINPGDQVYVSVWITDLNGNYNTSGGIGRFYIADLTTNQYTYPFPYLQIGGTFLGDTAEWVVERPAQCQSANPPTNCTLYNLADYGQVTMTSTFSLDSNSGYHTWYGDSGYGYYMENSGPGFIDRLSMPFALDQGNTIQFDWYHFD